MDVVALTRELVGHNTVSHLSNAPLANKLIEVLQDLDFTIEQQLMPDRPGALKLNLIGRRASQAGRIDGGLLLAGHMDTVPFRPDQKATLAATQEGAWLYGRGTCDMKGGIAAMLEAAARFKGRALKAPLTLAFTCEEEIGCLGAKALLNTSLLRAEHAIIGEPTSLAPKRMHKGYYGLEFTVKGKAAHSSDPSKGVSAIKGAMRAILGIEALEQQLMKLPGVTPRGSFHPDHATLNVGLLNAGVARNVIPEQAVFTVEVRPLPGQDMLKFMDQLEKVVAQTVALVGCTMSARRVTTDDAMLTAADAPIVQFLESWSGHKAGAISFSTEGKEFNKMGMQSVIFGPGSIDKAHQEDEFVPLEELGLAAEAYAAAIQTFCG